VVGVEVIVAVVVVVVVDVRVLLSRASSMSIVHSFYFVGTLFMPYTLGHECLLLMLLILIILMILILLK
jgi:hypothetical protein